MWNKITGKSSDAASSAGGERRRKGESSSGGGRSRRAESVTSSSAAGKRERDEERSAKRSAVTRTNGAPSESGVSSYATAPSRDARSERGSERRAGRDRGYEENGWGKRESDREDSRDRVGKRRERESSRDRNGKRRVQEKESDREKEERRRERREKRERDAKRRDTGERGLGREESTRAAETNDVIGAPFRPTMDYTTSDPHIAHQFPGQGVDAPFRPMQNAAGPGLAAEYYGDMGESVYHQPGVRPDTPLMNGQPHLMAATVEATPAPDTGHGAAEDYFGGGAILSDNGEAVTASSSKPAKSSQGTPNKKPSRPSSKPSKTSASGKPIGAAALAGGAALGYALGHQNENASASTSSLYVHGGQGSSSAVYDQGALSPSGQSYSLPAPSTGATMPGQFPDQSPRVSPGQSPVGSPHKSHLGSYAMGAAGLAAGAYALHNHNSSHQHSSSAPGGYNNYAAASGYNPAPGQPGYNPPHGQPGHNGHMAMDHRHEGPMSRISEWWKDHEDVRKMEEYTEYIGVCKYCFDPSTNIYDAPRKHNFRKRKSTDSLRSGGSGRRSGDHGRVSKESRYYRQDNSDGDERKGKSSNKKGWIAAGLGAYGLAKAGKAVLGRNGDFDDTYSVKSGRRARSSRTGLDRSRSSSRDRRSSHGVVRRKRSSSLERRSSRASGSVAGSYVDVVAGGQGDYRVERRRSKKTRSRSSSRDGRASGLLGAVAAAAIGGSAIAAHERRKHRSRSNSPDKTYATVRRRRRGSPESVSVYQTGSSSKHRSSRGSLGSEKESVGLFGAFFSGGDRRRRTSPRRKKKTGLFTFGNGSSSSDLGLAYGGDVRRNTRKISSEKPSRKRRSSDERLASLAVGITATTAALAAAQAAKSKHGRGSDLVAVKQRRERTRGTYLSRPSDATTQDESDDGGVWEDDPNDSSDGYESDGLAYGDWRSRKSTDSLASNDSGTWKWGWRWGSKKNKKRASTDSLGNIAAGAAAGAVGVSMMLGKNNEASSSQASMQSVYPVQSGTDPARFEAMRRNENTPLWTARPENNLRLEQPQPLKNVGGAVYATSPSFTTGNAPVGPPVDFAVDKRRQRDDAALPGGEPVDFAARDGEKRRLTYDGKSARREEDERKQRPVSYSAADPARRRESDGEKLPQLPSRRRRASSPPQTSSFGGKEAAIAGAAAVAGIAAASALSSGSKTPGTPGKDVRFDLDREHERARGHKEEEKRREEDAKLREEQGRKEVEARRLREEEDRARERRREEEGRAEVARREAERRSEVEREATRRAEMARDEGIKEQRQRDAERARRERDDAARQAAAREASAREAATREEALREEAMRVEREREVAAREAAAREEARRSEDARRAEQEREAYSREEARKLEQERRDYDRRESTSSRQRRQDRESDEGRPRERKSGSERNESWTKPIAAGVAGAAAAAGVASVIGSRDDKNKDVSEKEIPFDSRYEVYRAESPTPTPIAVAEPRIVAPLIKEIVPKVASNVEVDEFDDDVIFDPDYFKKSKDKKAAAVQLALAGKAADKVIEDMQARYGAEEVNNETFWAPDVLKDHSHDRKVVGPNADVDIQVLHDGVSIMAPPYERPYSFTTTRDVSGPWPVPVLKLTEATPPASRANSMAGSIKGSAPPSPVVEPTVVEEPVGEELERTRSGSSKVRWGKDQTYHYDVTTPESFRENFISEQDATSRPKQSFDEIVVEEDGKASTYKPPASTVTDAHAMESSIDEEIPMMSGAKSGGHVYDAESPEATPIVITPGSDPTRTSDFYQTPFFETVSDLGSRFDVPEDPRKAHGYVEGEVFDETPKEEEDLSKDMPGGFIDDDDDVPTPLPSVSRAHEVDSSVPAFKADAPSSYPDATGIIEAQDRDRDAVDEWSAPSSKSKKGKKKAKKNREAEMYFPASEPSGRTEAIAAGAAAAAGVAALGAHALSSAKDGGKEENKTPDVFQYMDHSPDEPAERASKNGHDDRSARSIEDSGYISRYQSIPDLAEVETPGLEERGDDDESLLDASKKKKKRSSKYEEDLESSAMSNNGHKVAQSDELYEDEKSSRHHKSSRREDDVESPGRRESYAASEFGDEADSKKKRRSARDSEIRDDVSVVSSRRDEDSPRRSYPASEPGGDQDSSRRKRRSKRDSEIRDDVSVASTSKLYDEDRKRRHKRDDDDDEKRRSSKDKDKDKKGGLFGLFGNSGKSDDRESKKSKSKDDDEEKERRRKKKSSRSTAGSDDEGEERHHHRHSKSERSSRSAAGSGDEREENVRRREDDEDKERRRKKRSSRSTAGSDDEGEDRHRRRHHSKSDRSNQSFDDGDKSERRKSRHGENDDIGYKHDEEHPYSRYSAQPPEEVLEEVLSQNDETSSRRSNGSSRKSESFLGDRAEDESADLAAPLPASTTSGEIAPPALPEKTRKTPEVEDSLPPLPDSASTSRTPSLHDTDDDNFLSAAESPEASFHETFDEPRHALDDDHGWSAEPGEYLDSQQATPKATSFPEGVLDVHREIPDHLYMPVDETPTKSRDPSPSGFNVKNVAAFAGVSALAGLAAREALSSRHSDKGHESDFMAGSAAGDDDEEFARYMQGEAKKQEVEQSRPVLPRKGSKKGKKGKKGSKSETFDDAFDQPQQQPTDSELRERDAIDAVDTWFQDPVKEPEPVEPESPKRATTSVVPEVLLQRVPTKKGKKKGKKGSKSGISSPEKREVVVPLDELGASSTLAKTVNVFDFMEDSEDPAAERALEMPSEQLENQDVGNVQAAHVALPESPLFVPAAEIALPSSPALAPATEHSTSRDLTSVGGVQAAEIALPDSPKLVSTAKRDLPEKETVQAPVDVFRFLDRSEDDTPVPLARDVEENHDKHVVAPSAAVDTPELAVLPEDIDSALSSAPILAGADTAREMPVEERKQEPEEPDIETFRPALSRKKSKGKKGKKVQQGDPWADEVPAEQDATGSTAVPTDDEQVGDIARELSIDNLKQDVGKPEADTFAPALSRKKSKGKKGNKGQKVDLWADDVPAEPSTTSQETMRNVDETPEQLSVPAYKASEEVVQGPPQTVVTDNDDIARKAREEAEEDALLFGDVTPPVQESDMKELTREPTLEEQAAEDELLFGDQTPPVRETFVTPAEEAPRYDLSVEEAATTPTIEEKQTAEDKLLFNDETPPSQETIVEGSEVPSAAALTIEEAEPRLNPDEQAEEDNVLFGDETPPVQDKKLLVEDAKTDRGLEEQATEQSAEDEILFGDETPPVHGHRKSDLDDIELRDESQSKPAGVEVEAQKVDLADDETAADPSTIIEEAAEVEAVPEPEAISSEVIPPTPEDELVQMMSGQKKAGKKGKRNRYVEWSDTEETAPSPTPTHEPVQPTTTDKAEHIGITRDDIEPSQDDIKAREVEPTDEIEPVQQTAGKKKKGKKGKKNQNFDLWAADESSAQLSVSVDEPRVVEAVDNSKNIENDERGTTLEKHVLVAAPVMELSEDAADVPLPVDEALLETPTAIQQHAFSRGFEQNDEPVLGLTSQVEMQPEADPEAEFEPVQVSNSKKKKGKKEKKRGSTVREISEPATASTINPSIAEPEVEVENFAAPGDDVDTFSTPREEPENFFTPKKVKGKGKKRQQKVDLWEQEPGVETPEQRDVEPAAIAIPVIQNERLELAEGVDAHRADQIEPAAVAIPVNDNEEHELAEPAILPEADWIDSATIAIPIVDNEVLESADCEEPPQSRQLIESNVKVADSTRHEHPALAAVLMDEVPSTNEARPRELELPPDRADHSPESIELPMTDDADLFEPPTTPESPIGRRVENVDVAVKDGTSHILVGPQLSPRSIPLPEGPEPLLDNVEMLESRGHIELSPVEPEDRHAQDDSSTPQEGIHDNRATHVSGERDLAPAEELEPKPIIARVAALGTAALAGVGALLPFAKHDEDKQVENNSVKESERENKPVEASPDPTQSDKEQHVEGELAGASSTTEVADERSEEAAAEDEWAIPSKKGKKGKRNAQAARATKSDPAEPMLSPGLVEPLTNEPAGSAPEAVQDVVSDPVAEEDFTWAAPRKGKKGKKGKKSGTSTPAIFDEQRSANVADTEQIEAFETGPQSTLPEAETEPIQAAAEDEWAPTTSKKKDKKKGKKGKQTILASPAIVEALEAAPEVLERYARTAESKQTAEPELSIPHEADPAESNRIMEDHTELEHEENQPARINEQQTITKPETTVAYDYDLLESQHAATDHPNLEPSKRCDLDTEAMIKTVHAAEEPPLVVERSIAVIEPATELAVPRAVNSSQPEHSDGLHLSAKSLEAEQANAEPNVESETLTNVERALPTTSEHFEPADVATSQFSLENKDQKPDDASTLSSAQPTFENLVANADANDEWAMPSKKSKKKDKKGKKSGATTPADFEQSISAANIMDIEPSHEHSVPAEVKESESQQLENAPSASEAIVEDEWAIPSKEDKKKGKKGKQSIPDTLVNEDVVPKFEPAGAMEIGSIEQAREMPSERAAEEVAEEVADEEWELPSSKKSKNNGKKGKQSKLETPVDEEIEPILKTVEPTETLSVEQPIVGPSESTANEEWAVPTSKKSRKKGKKGQQSRPDTPPPQIEHHVVEDIPMLDRETPSDDAPLVEVSQLRDLETLASIPHDVSENDLREGPHGDIVEDVGAPPDQQVVEAVAPREQYSLSNLPSDESAIEQVTTREYTAAVLADREATMDPMDDIQPSVPTEQTEEGEEYFGFITKKSKKGKKGKRASTAETSVITETPSTEPEVTSSQEAESTAMEQSLPTETVEQAPANLATPTPSEQPEEDDFFAPVLKKGKKAKRGKLSSSTSTPTIVENTSVEEPIVKDPKTDDHVVEEPDVSLEIVPAHEPELAMGPQERDVLAGRKDTRSIDMSTANNIQQIPNTPSYVEESFAEPEALVTHGIEPAVEMTEQGLPEIEKDKPVHVHTLGISHDPQMDSDVIKELAAESKPAPANEAEVVTDSLDRDMPVNIIGETPVAPGNAEDVQQQAEDFSAPVSRKGKKGKQSKKSASSSRPQTPSAVKPTAETPESYFPIQETSIETAETIAAVEEVPNAVTLAESSTQAEDEEFWGPVSKKGKKNKKGKTASSGAVTPALGETISLRGVPGSADDLQVGKDTTLEGTTVKDLLESSEQAPEEDEWAFTSSKKKNKKGKKGKAIELPVTPPIVNQARQAIDQASEVHTTQIVAVPEDAINASLPASTAMKIDEKEPTTSKKKSRSRPRDAERVLPIDADTVAMDLVSEVLQPQKGHLLTDSTQTQNHTTQRGLAITPTDEAAAVPLPHFDSMELDEYPMLAEPAGYHDEVFQAESTFVQPVQEPVSALQEAADVTLPISDAEDLEEKELIDSPSKTEAERSVPESNSRSIVQDADIETTTGKREIAAADKTPRFETKPEPEEFAWATTKKAKKGKKNKNSRVQIPEEDISEPVAPRSVPRRASTSTAAEVANMLKGDDMTDIPEASPTKEPKTNEPIFDSSISMVDTSPQATNTVVLDAEDESSWLAKENSRITSLDDTHENIAKASESSPQLMPAKIGSAETLDEVVLPVQTASRDASSGEDKIADVEHNFTTPKEVNVQEVSADAHGVDDNIQRNTALEGQSLVKEQGSEDDGVEGSGFASKKNKKEKRKGKKGKKTLDDDEETGGDTSLARGLMPSVDAQDFALENPHRASPVQVSHEGPKEVLGVGTPPQGLVASPLEVGDVTMEDDSSGFAGKKKKDKKKGRKGRVNATNEEDDSASRGLPAAEEKAIVDDPPQIETMKIDSDQERQAADDFSTKRSKKEKRKAKQDKADTAPEPITTDVRFSGITVENVKELGLDQSSTKHGDTPQEQSTGVDFAASVAAGLESSGFDPNIAVSHSAFHRPSSASRALEDAEFDELPLQAREASRQTSRQNSRRQSRAASADASSRVQLDESSDARPPPNDHSEFAAVLAAGLAGSGFHPDILDSNPVVTQPNSSSSKSLAEEEIEGFSEKHQQPKRGRKARKYRSASPPQAVEKTTVAESSQPMVEPEAIPSEAVGSVEKDRPNSGTLPAGWFPASDPTTGKTYYYTAAGAVQWDLPTISAFGEPSQPFQSPMTNEAPSLDVVAQPKEIGSTDPASIASEDTTAAVETEPSRSLAAPERTVYESASKAEVADAIEPRDLNELGESEIEDDDWALPVKKSRKSGKKGLKSKPMEDNTLSDASIIAGAAVASAGLGLAAAHEHHSGKEEENSAAQDIEMVESSRSLSPLPKEVGEASSPAGRNTRVTSLFPGLERVKRKVPPRQDSIAAEQHPKRVSTGNEAALVRVTTPEPLTSENLDMTMHGTPRNQESRLAVSDQPMQKQTSAQELTQSSWSFPQNRDSAMVISDSPNSPVSSRNISREVARDSGYHDSPTLPRTPVAEDLDDGQFPTSRSLDRKGKARTASHESHGSNKSGMKVLVEASPEWGIQVTHGTPAREIPDPESAQLEDSLPRAMHSQEYPFPASRTPLSPSAIESTSKDRSSALLFQSSPSTRERLSVEPERSQVEAVAPPNFGTREKSRGFSKDVEMVYDRPPIIHDEHVQESKRSAGETPHAEKTPHSTPATHNRASSVGLHTIMETSPASPESPLVRKTKPHSHHHEQGSRSLRRSATPEHLNFGASPQQLHIDTHGSPKHVKSTGSMVSMGDLIDRRSWPPVDEDKETVEIDKTISGDPAKRVRSAEHARTPSSARDTRRISPMGDLRPLSAMSDRSGHYRGLDSAWAMSPNISRPISSMSNASVRSDRSLRHMGKDVSGDLRSQAKRQEANVGAKISDGAPQLLAGAAGIAGIALASAALSKDQSTSRGLGMEGEFEGVGRAPDSPMSPTRPPSVRKRQSMQIMDLQGRIDQVVNENRSLQEAKQRAEQALLEATHLRDGHANTIQQATEAVASRDLALQEKDAQITQLTATLAQVQQEIDRVTEHNTQLSSQHQELSTNASSRAVSLETEKTHAHAQWQNTARELDELKIRHQKLNEGIDEIVRDATSIALADKDAQIEELQQELANKVEEIKSLQAQLVTAAQGETFLTIRNEDFFDSACQQLCLHVQQWVLKFSKFSDTKICRLSSDVSDEKLRDRLDDAILDGSDVDVLLADRIKRRDVFMSIVMSMIWEYVFTRYLFGMDREQRKKLKTLEETLNQVGKLDANKFETERLTTAGPQRAVAQWRAITLTLLTRRDTFIAQRKQDTEAVVQEIFSNLSTLLSPPADLANQSLNSLRKVLTMAVDLAIDMRTQRAEYIMLPPLKPEYDTNGDLVQKVQFNATLMNERSGEFSNNEELEERQANVRIVLFPLVVKKGDDLGEGEDEIVVCPAQVLIAKPAKDKKVVRVMSGVMEIDSRRSMASLAQPDANMF